MTMLSIMRVIKEVCLCVCASVCPPAAAAKKPLVLNCTLGNLKVFLTEDYDFCVLVMLVSNKG